MFGSLRTFISKLVDDSGSPNQFQHEARLATAALLIRVATVDSEITKVKRTRLHDVLKLGFGLDDVTTVQLIDDAVTAGTRSATISISVSHLAKSMKRSMMKAAAESFR